MPSLELVRKALNAARKRVVDYEFFFDHLKSPDWIEPLSKENMFRDPPAAMREGDYIKFPFWPESKYLARMAEHAPALVLRVLLEVPETDNIRVHEDMADAALAMPADLAAKWVKREIEWLVKQDRLYFTLFPEKLGALVAHLAKGGQKETALELAKVFLAILPDPKRVAKSEMEGNVPFAPDPHARFDLWEYQEIFKKYMPEFVRACGIDAFNLFCDLLKDAIRFSRRRDEDDGTEDYSYIWRESIENSKEHSHGVQNILVSGIRDAGELLIKEKILTLQEAAQILESRSRKIFLRISLHLLKQFSEYDDLLVATHLTNYALFDDYGVRHEYALLLRKCFDRLDESQREIILGWVEAGPDLLKYKEAELRLSGKQRSDSEAEKYRLYWQRDRLAWFKDQLPDEWKARYQQLVLELGEPEDSTYPFRTQTGWVGPTSPKSIDDLKQMTVAEIVDYLNIWKPPQGVMEASPEGLGRNLAEAAKQQPEKFSSNAICFLDTHPTYVRAIISGLADALKEKQRFEWPVVLELCRLIIELPRSLTGKQLKFSKDCDSDWGCTRSAIARLLSKGFEEDYLSFEMRAIVWSVLEPLTHDPEPTPEYEAKYGGSNMDPSMLSINTTRGEAMHAVIRYALWIRRNIEKLTNAKEKIARGFDEMPEVRTVLDEHLNISKDFSLAIRSVYGQWLPWLVLFDSDWVKKNIGLIFPDDEKQHSLRDAAWSAYMLFCNAYDNVFDAISSEYDRALGDWSKADDKKTRAGDPCRRLAEHLMVFYWRGKLPDAMFQKFWANAPEKVRGHAIKFIGRTFYGEENGRTSENVPPEILGRMRSLWDSRINFAQEAVNPKLHATEINDFGWWFISKKFDDRWAMDQLLSVLKISKSVEPDHLVVERLAELVPQMPNDVVTALRLMVEGAKEPWTVSSWRETGKDVLEKALQTDARQSAEDLIHYLGSQGYLEFGELLRG